MYVLIGMIPSSCSLTTQCRKRGPSRRCATIERFYRMFCLVGMLPLSPCWTTSLLISLGIVRPFSIIVFTLSIWPSRLWTWLLVALAIKIVSSFLLILVINWHQRPWDLGLSYRLCRLLICLCWLYDCFLGLFSVFGLCNCFCHTWFLSAHTIRLLCRNRPDYSRIL